MTWHSIRLELDRTREFPNGSAGRAYLLRLPLLDDGVIDEPAVERFPEQATMRRLWSNEPEISGYIRRDQDRWTCIFSGRNGDDSIVSQFEATPIQPGGRVMVSERTDGTLPFRIARMRPLTSRR